MEMEKEGIYKGICNHLAHFPFTKQKNKAPLSFLLRSVACIENS